MAKIRIKNFGPIKAGFTEGDGFIDVKKVTVFIGNQGSGKSTVAKLISTFLWMEKVLTRGDYAPKEFIENNRFRKKYLAYHRIEKYFFDNENNDQALIEFSGDSFNFKYEHGSLSIDEIRSANYYLPQIMYVPAERNFIANVKTPRAIRLTSDSLVEFVAEFDNAKNEMKGPLPLPIDNVSIDFNKLNDIVYLKGTDYRIQLKEASSGFQSLVPLYLVSWYLANSIKSQSENSKAMSSDEMERFRKGVIDIWTNESLSDDQRRVALSVLSSRFNKTAFINIVEEPEQNLFPSSQQLILYSLLGFNNLNPLNKLIMTTHSPYLINYLTLAVKAELIDEMTGSAEIEKKINEIVPVYALIKPDDLAIYELSEKTGEIKKLKTFAGIPSDQNSLNSFLHLANKEYDALLDIEEQI